MRPCSECGAASRRAASEADGLCTVCVPEPEEVAVELLTGDLPVGEVDVPNVMVFDEPLYLENREVSFTFCTKLSPKDLVLLKTTFGFQLKVDGSVQADEIIILETKDDGNRVRHVIKLDESSQH